MRRDVFQAIADPTRREIINFIAQKPMNVTTIGEQFDISRPAVSKHIKILTECGLITIINDGRERYCQANLKPLRQVSYWVEQYSAFWTKKLDALGDFLEQENKQVHKRKSSKKSRSK